MTIIIIDGKEHDVDPDLTLIQALEDAGVEIPRFCFHERLSIAGNCRMCLVEVVGAPKPAASCHMGVRDLRPGRNGEPPEILTKSPMVKKSREGVMEFLLVNHPLDCPICDQGGECDLQDQAMAYGIEKSRYDEAKRAVEDKYIGPLVKTTMTRCIHCTRCVRFTSEVAGVDELGAIGRGEDMEITTYLEQAMTSELQGNIIDLCPVGALTSKPYAFSARSWELRKTESIDVMDAVGSSIRLDTRGREVMRIMPRNQDEVNEEWISDKTRFVWDGLKSQRLDRPYVRRNGKLEPTSWNEAFAAIVDKVKTCVPERIGAVIGDLAACEEIFALKSLLMSLGSSNIDCRQNGAGFDPALGRSSYVFNPSIAGIEDADRLVIIGSNPRIEAPVLNARIRKRWLTGELKISVIGERADLTYDYEYLGSGPKSLEHLSGQGLVGMERSIWLIGEGALARPDGTAIAAMVAAAAISTGSVSDDWNGFAVLHSAASRVGALDLGAVPATGALDAGEMAASGALDVLFLLGADEIDVKLGAFVVYIGSHGDQGAHRADVILPGAAYTEKSGTFVNTEGRVQIARRAVFPPGEAAEDWAILRALSERLNHTLPFDRLEKLREEMISEAPVLGQLNKPVKAMKGHIEALAARSGTVIDEAFVSSVSDFYLTNPIARSSQIMAECSALRAELKTRTGTDG
jgi:NADH-quinone oxidoreductase subunit G